MSLNKTYPCIIHLWPGIWYLCKKILKNYRSWSKYPFWYLFVSPCVFGTGMAAKNEVDMMRGYKKVQVVKDDRAKMYVDSIAQVSDADVLALSNSEMIEIRKSLIANGHWANNLESNANPQCLASRINTDMETIKEAGICRASLLWFFECIKGFFDACINIRDKEDNLRTPTPTLVVSDNKFEGSTQSIKGELIYAIAGDTRSPHLQAMVSLFATDAGHKVHAIFDTNHAKILAYRLKDHTANPIHAEILQIYTEANVRSRNHFIKTIGHAQHIVQLLRQPAKLAEVMQDRKQWSLWRETMMMVTPNIIAYRVEWGGSEYCPIYRHFEKTYIGYLRGNVDWFFCNVTNGSIVWVPDLAVYQAGLFGFLQGPGSKYRLDLLGIMQTIMSSFDNLESANTDESRFAPPPSSLTKKDQATKTRADSSCTSDID